VRAVLVPGVLALLPEYAGLEDPVAGLRAVCVEAVCWLEAAPIVLADPQGERVARALLDAAGGSETVAAQPPRPPTTPAYLVVGNGSARRGVKAPGHLDERSHGFDDALRAALVAGEVSGVDRALGAELMAAVDGIARLAEVLPAGATVSVDYDDDPFGVQYWVMRWEW
jgi:hypothetical protein